MASPGSGWKWSCTVRPMEDNRQWKPQRKALLEKIGGRVVKQQFEKKDADGKTISEEKESLEDGVLAWGRENDRSMDEFRAMVREFYGDKAPKVMDPFAGGGAIPLEAMRLGCDVTASDLNPVAWFILKFTPPAQLNVFDFLFNPGGMFTP